MAGKIPKMKDLEQVKEHYMDYPYPFRDPEDEKSRLLSLMGESLPELNHWLYKGKQNFKKGFRILIAGGGTGDCSTYMAEQLKNTDAEIVYLDFSKNSMEIAKKRAEVRGLKNITWINDSIYNIPDLKLGKFDFINCSGVLHHLESPQIGLKTLQESLKDDGGMDIMVYAQYGRTGVYHIQEIMRQINSDVSNRIEEVMNAKSIINILPQTNWFKRAEELIGDHINFGDVGIYDLFLHKQDRAYTIPQLHEYITDAGLNFVQFSDITERITLSLEKWIKDFSLLQKLQKKTLIEQQAICELIAGNVIKHTVYLTKSKKNPTASFEDLNNIPSFSFIGNIAEQTHAYLEQNPSLHHVTVTVNTSWLKQTPITIKVTPNVKAFLKHLSAKKQKTLQEIFDAIRKELNPQAKDKDLINEFEAFAKPFVHHGVFLLRDKTVKFD